MEEYKFNECVRTQSKRLYLIALSFTKNQADAEDILQNVYLKLFNCKKEFESDEHIAKWLTKVCINESKDLLRLHFRKRSVPLALLGTFWVIAAFAGQWPWQSNPYNSYALQTDSWLKGRLDLGQNYEWLELAIYQGK